MRSTVVCELSSPRCPDEFSGYGAEISGVHVRSGDVAGLSSRAALRIAWNGRQKAKWYLLFQVLIAASAAARFSIARSSAASETLKSFRTMSWRATSFQLATGLLCHHFAMYVCALVRVEAVKMPSPPIAFTSLKSAAQAALVSAGGPAPRNCEEPCIRNGSTPPTHGVGSCTVVPFGATGSQWPGALF